MQTTASQTSPETISLTRARPGSAFPFLALLSIALGVTLGVGSAWYAVSGQYPIGSVRAGPWVFWPRVGSRDIDPYARAIISRRRDLPLGVGEGVALIASKDDAGHVIEPRCDYRIGRITPQARAWTLSVYDASGHADPLQGTLYSGSVLRTPDGGFDIALSSDMRSGNWLRLPTGRSASLVLRLYDTPIASGTATLDRHSVPRIERLDCAS